MKRHGLLIGLMALTAALAQNNLIAQLGSRPAEEWIKRLERPERIAELKVDQIIEKLRLKPGDVIADLGAGAGVFTYPFARALAPKGKVYAVEVDKAFIDYIGRRVHEQQLANVTPVLGKFEDPLLPEKIDLAFFHDVLHHVENRAAYLKTVASYVKAGGRIAVIELDATRPDASHRNDPKLQVTKEQLQQWMAAAGLERTEEIPMFEDKWFVIYTKK